jgi:hypothetical protein
MRTLGINSREGGIFGEMADRMTKNDHAIRAALRR